MPVDDREFITTCGCGKPRMMSVPRGQGPIEGVVYCIFGTCPPRQPADPKKEPQEPARVVLGVLGDPRDNPELDPDRLRADMDECGGL